MLSNHEKPDNGGLESYLIPPRYDLMGVMMSVIAAIIISIISGIIILLVSYVSLGRFSLESGISPILLAMITFFGLSIGNILYYILLSKIFPDIYLRGRTAMAQVAIMSILLYIFFAPVYVIISSLSLDTTNILLAFSLHVVINTFCLQLVIGLTAQYRYALLTLYANVISLLLTMSILIFLYFHLSDSSIALFMLLGLVIIAQTSGSFFSHSILWGYHLFYKNTGYDPIGTVFARIENEEKEIEQQAEKILTQFPKN